MRANRVDRTGQQVGDYLIERKLGRGGMSVVWFARHVGTGKPAAVKVLNAGLPANIEAERRLTQEARATKRMEHAHVVQMYAWGETDPPEARPYLAMEYLEGVALSTLIGRGKTLSVERALDIALQVLDVLDQAHALDIIHRDIKPDNILLVTREGRSDFVKMLDFGIAKLRGAQPHTAVQTARGIVLGTPEYLPPEVALDHGVCPESDLYALGCILFEALTGRLPFTGRTPMALAEAHCFAPIPRPRDFNPDLPAALEEVIVHCLAKQPQDRYRKAADLANDLQAFVTVDTPAPTLVSAPLPVIAREVTRSPKDRVGLLETRLKAVLKTAWQGRTLPGPVVRSLTRVEGLRTALDEVQADLALASDGAADPLALDVTREESDFFGDELQIALEEEAAAQEALADVRARDADLRGRIEALDGDVVTKLLELLDDGDVEQIIEGPLLDEVGERLQRSEALAEVERARVSLQAELEAAEANHAAARSHRVQLEADQAVAAALGETAEIRMRAHRRALQVREQSLVRQKGEALSQLALDLALAAGSRRR